VAKAILVLVSLTLVASCAGQAPVTPPLAVAAAGRSTRVPVAEAATPSTTAAPSDPGDVPNKDLINRGFRVTRIHGQMVYCRSEPVTGSNFKSTLCLTEAQILTNEQNAKDFANQFQGQVCTDRMSRCSN
jgi:hypothetical protein